jgi:hypothetical protein
MSPKSKPTRKDSGRPDTQPSAKRKPKTREISANPAASLNLLARARRGRR